MKFCTRSASLTDARKILDLYKKVAKVSGGITREEEEITHEHVSKFIHKALKSGVCLVIEDPDNPENIIAEMHCYTLKPKVFKHILSELTIVVHPKFQSKGIGRKLFSTVLKQLEDTRPDVLRVELIARESNENAIEFYKKLGFVVEGRFEKRIKGKNGYEADIPMAWFNKNFKED